MKDSELKPRQRRSRIDGRKPVDKGGRRRFDGKDEKIIIQKLEQVWALDGTDEEAAIYAGISKAALSEYLKINLKVAERKALLKNQPVLKARTTIVNSLSNSTDAKWFLTKKRPAEFGDKLKIDGEVQVTTINDFIKQTYESIERRKRAGDSERDGSDDMAE